MERNVPKEDGKLWSLGFHLVRSEGSGGQWYLLITTLLLQEKECHKNGKEE